MTEDDPDPPADGLPPADDLLADKRRRLGTALHQLASELAEERRRNKELEREVERLRSRLERSGA